MGIRPNAELVAIYWLKALEDLPTNQIGTTLPAESDDFAENGFIQVRSQGGVQDNESFMQRSILTLTANGYNKDSGKIPWAKVNNLLMIVKEGMESGARVVTTPDAFNNARVFYVESVSDPQRVVGDGAVGKYRMRIRLHWVEI